MHPVGRLKFTHDNVTVTIKGKIVTWRLVLSDEAADSPDRTEVNFDDLVETYQQIDDSNTAPQCKCTKWEIDYGDNLCGDEDGEVEEDEDDQPDEEE